MTIFDNKLEMEPNKIRKYECKSESVGIGSLVDVKPIFSRDSRYE